MKKIAMYLADATIEESLNYIRLLELYCNNNATNIKAISYYTSDIYDNGILVGKSTLNKLIENINHQHIKTLIIYSCNSIGNSTFKILDEATKKNDCTLIVLKDESLTRADN